MRRGIFFFPFSPNEQCGGWGVCCQTFFLLFSFPWCSANHERDWPPCKVVFRVGNQYAECEKEQQQQQQLMPNNPSLLRNAIRFILASYSHLNGLGIYLFVYLFICLFFIPEWVDDQKVQMCSDFLFSVLV